MSPEATNDAADQQAAADVGARQQELKAGIPMATEPLKPNVLNALGETIGTTMTRLANHKVDLPYTPVSEPVEQVPADLGSQIIALHAMVQKLGPQVPELEPYAFDAEAVMSTNDGLRELTSIVGKMGADEKLSMALRAPKGKDNGQGAPDDADDDGDGDGDGGKPAGGGKPPGSGSAGLRPAPATDRDDEGR